MKKIAGFFILFLAVSYSWASLPKRIVCDSKDQQDPVKKFGKVTFIFSPLSVVNLKEGQSKAKVIFADAIVCGHDTSGMAVKPACSMLDKSGQNYLQIGLDCKQDFGAGNVRWFANGGLIITDKASGQFDCTLKYPGSAMQLLLKNCVAQ